MPLDIYDFYHRCLLPMTPHPAVIRIMELVMSGGETTDDFAQVLAKDSELQHWVRLTVQRLGFDKRSNKLDQMVTLLGQNRIRDLIIGRSIERSFVPADQTIYGKLLAQKAKENAQKQDAAAASKEAPKENTEAKAAEEAPPAEDSPDDTIPSLSDFKVYTEYAIRSEEVAISIRNSYPSQAFAGGVIFDYLRAFLKAVPLDKVSDPRLTKVENYLDEIFIDGLRCGIAANEIIQKISVHHQRTVFVSALAHNIGKALLFAYDPALFEKAFLSSTGAGADSKIKMQSTDAEDEHFDLDHAQAGSLYLGRLPYLAEIERSVDYHHNPHLLRFSNPKLYALACVLRVSGALVKLDEKSRKTEADASKIRDQRLIASEDFAFLQLNTQDWEDIKGNYALKLMKVQL